MLCKRVYDRVAGVSSNIPRVDVFSGLADLPWRERDARTEIEGCVVKSGSLLDFDGQVKNPRRVTQQLRKRHLPRVPLLLSYRILGDSDTAPSLVNSKLSPLQPYYANCTSRDL